MSTATSTKSTSIGTIPNWSKRIEGETDPNNREIKAYELGIEDRKIQEKEEIDTLFKTNLELCCYYSTKFHDFLTIDNHVECILGKIKAEEIDKFHSIFVIKFEDYKNADLRSTLYKQINSFRKALSTKDICFEVSILASSTTTFDKTALEEDGFILEYRKDEPKGKEAN